MDYSGTNLGISGKKAEDLLFAAMKKRSVRTKSKIEEAKVKPYWR